eukprot:13015939-Heterocapsa_arctica.AAC.1
MAQGGGNITERKGSVPKEGESIDLNAQEDIDGSWKVSQGRAGSSKDVRIPSGVRIDVNRYEPIRLAEEAEEVAR